MDKQHIYFTIKYLIVLLTPFSLTIHRSQLKFTLSIIDQLKYFDATPKTTLTARNENHLPPDRKASISPDTCTFAWKYI